MHRLAYYHALTLAHLHASHLRDQGIMAGVLGERLTTIAPLSANNLGRGQYELVIATKRAEPQARAILDELERNPPTLQDDWEHDTQPDLTKLDPDLLPPCPTCNRPTSPTRPLGPCPNCGLPHNLIDLIIAAHGPEALEPCYHPKHPLDDFSDDEINAIELDCPSCEYPLEGLGITGVCPECASPFNKRAMFDDLLDSAL